MLRIPNVESFRSMLDASDLLTFKQFAQEYPAFPMNRLRYLYDSRETKGISHVFVKVGKLRMVSKSEFNAWLTAQQEGRKN
jgi:hypothetical protein